MYYLKGSRYDFALNFPHNIKCIIQGIPKFPYHFFNKLDTFVSVTFLFNVSLLLKAISNNIKL